MSQSCFENIMILLPLIDSFLDITDITNVDMLKPFECSKDF